MTTLIELVVTAELVFPKYSDSNFVARLKLYGCGRGFSQGLLLCLTERASAARSQKGYTQQSAKDEDRPYHWCFIPFARRRQKASSKSLLRHREQATHFARFHRTTMPRSLRQATRV